MARGMSDDGLGIEMQMAHLSHSLLLGMVVNSCGGRSDYTAGCGPSGDRLGEFGLVLAWVGEMPSVCKHKFLKTRHQKAQA